MEGNIKLSATVISCMGSEADRDDFYFNGNFSNCHHTQSIQCSFEKSSNHFIFAVSDAMGLDDGSADNISAMREIKRYHESVNKQQFALETIAEKIYESIQLSSNLIYSKSIVASQNESLLTGFSSVIIDNSRAVLMNLGNNGAFLYRNGENIDIFNRGGSPKNEKLKMLGINPNTAEIFNDAGKILKLAEQESKTKIRISQSFEIAEGDTIILCSDGLLNTVSKRRIEAVVDSGFEPSKIASILFQEASKEGMEEGITVVVLRVLEIKNATYTYPQKNLNRVEYENESEEDEDENTGKSGYGIVNYILAFICVVVISGVLFMGYLIFKNSGIMAANPPSDDTSQISTGMGGISDDSAGLSTDEPEDSADTDEPGESSDSQPSKEPDDKDQQGEQPDKNAGGTDDEYEVYIVKSGDTLSSISSKFYSNPNKYDAIIKFNGLKNENSLQVGQELKIPRAN